MTPQPARQQRTLLSIGQVLQRLTPEFPELTPSKIRFLEDQGLITPERTESGYRKFSPELVERIRTILALQRDHYLPLKVIRAHLEEVDAGRVAALPVTDVELQSPSILPTGRKLSRGELMAESGASRALIAEAQRQQLLPAVEPFDEPALAVASALVALGRFGIEPRHLRGMRTTAEREAALIEQAVRPLLSNGERSGKQRAEDAAREMFAHLDVLRASFSRGALASIWQ